MTTPPDDFPDGDFSERDAAEAWDEGVRQIGRFNLAVFGKTGVGKSTLINAIFGAEVAATGVGQPVTQGSHLYLARAGALGLYDTKGIEIGTSADQVLAEVRRLIDSTRTATAGEHIHAAYYCVRAGALRLEESEIGFIRGLHEAGLPVFLVLTQVHRRGGVYRQEHIDFAQHIHDVGLPIHSGRPYLTMALPDSELGFEQHGLAELLDATYQKVPEAAQAALAAAQRIDMELKRRTAKKVIGTAAGSAAAVGASPIPFSDAALLVPIQMTMMGSIARVYGVPLNSALAASVASTALATQAGKTLVTAALKFLPGVNYLVLGVSAGVASAFTTSMGATWMRVCEMALAGRFGDLDDLDNDALKSVFINSFKEHFTGALSEITKRARP